MSPLVSRLMSHVSISNFAILKRFVDELKVVGVEFFAGVPDSLLKGFCAYVTDTCVVK